jgi:hypothetical protein
LKNIEFKASQIVCLDALQRWWRGRERTKTSNKNTPMDLTKPWMKRSQGAPAEKVILGSTAHAAVDEDSALIDSPLFDVLHSWWSKYKSAQEPECAAGAAYCLMQATRAPWNHAPQGATTIRLTVVAENAAL